MPLYLFMYKDRHREMITMPFRYISGRNIITVRLKSFTFYFSLLKSLFSKFVFEFLCRRVLLNNTHPIRDLCKQNSIKMIKVSAIQEKKKDCLFFLRNNKVIFVKKKGFVLLLVELGKGLVRVSGGSPWPHAKFDQLVCLKFNVLRRQTLRKCEQ